MAYTQPANGTPTWLSKYRAALEAGRKATATIPAPRPATTSHVIAPQIPTKQYIPPGPEPGSYVPPGLEPERETVADRIVPLLPKFPALRHLGNDLRSRVVGDGLYDRIDSDMRRTYGMGTDLQRRIVGYQDAEATPSDRYFGPEKAPYSDDVPRLFDYSQQQDKFGTFEDYQKAVDARKHGFVPNDYKDLAGAGEGEGEAGDEEVYYYPSYPGYGSSGYGSGYAAQQQYGVKPNWELWATFIQQTTWNV